MKTPAPKHDAHSPRQKSTLEKPQGWTRGLLRCGLAAGPVFVAVFLFEGAVRDGYRPLRHPVSSLALGPRGWIQAGNFAVAGTLFLAGAAGLARAGDPASSSRAAPALVGAAGAGLICSAVKTLLHQDTASASSLTCSRLDEAGTKMSSSQAADAQAQHQATT